MDKMVFAATAVAASVTATAACATITLNENDMESKAKQEEEREEKKRQRLMATSFMAPEPSESVAISNNTPTVTTAFLPGTPKISRNNNHRQVNIAKVQKNRNIGHNSKAKAQSNANVRSFYKALVDRHERQTLNLGRLLHELHELAAEINPDNIDDTIAAKQLLNNTPLIPGVQKQVKMLKRVTESKIHVDNVNHDFTKITPDEAWEIIHKIRCGGVLGRRDLKRLSDDVSKVLLQDPTLVDLRDRDDLARVTVVGDLHGQLNSLFDVFNIVGDRDSVEPGMGTPWDGSGAIVFNGDFVDRGENSLEVIVILLLLKLAYPNHVYLNRGNHEDGILCKAYGFIDELRDTYDDGGPVEDIWDSFCNIFSALPLCVRTDHAAIMHGGIPRDGFQLKELEDITPEQRFKIKSTLAPPTKRAYNSKSQDNSDLQNIYQLFQDILWSDPRPQNGIEHNDARDVGKYYGPDVLRRFLISHDLKTLVRSHEVVDDGYEHLSCSDDDHSVVTVFSASAYSNGEGFNMGAILILDSDGTMHPIPFFGEESQLDENGSVLEQQSDQELGKRTFSQLAQIISQNKTKLLSAFQAKALAGQPLPENDDDDKTSQNRLITTQQWVDCMSSVLDLKNVDWLSLQQFLAPTLLVEADDAHSHNINETTSSFDSNNDCQQHQSQNKTHTTTTKILKDTGLIDYKVFLDMHCSTITASDSMRNLDPAMVDILLQNHVMLLTVFKFLDADRSGTIDRNEFVNCMKLLQAKKRISIHSKNDNDKINNNEDNTNLTIDPNMIFDAIDINGDGELELAEFERAFEVTDMPYDVALFKMFDSSGDGKIDRKEFHMGIKWLNHHAALERQKQYSSNLITSKDNLDNVDLNIDALFDEIDTNGDGEIDLNELRASLHKTFPEFVRQHQADPAQLS